MDYVVLTDQRILGTNIKRKECVERNLGPSASAGVTADLDLRGFGPPRIWTIFYRLSVPFSEKVHTGICFLPAGRSV